MGPFQRARACARLAIFGVSTLLLAACSSGGGNNAFNTGAAGSTSTTTPTTPSVSIGPVSVNASTTTAFANSSSQPNSIPGGTVFGLTQGAVTLGTTTIADASAQAATLSFLGVNTSSGFSTVVGAKGTPVYRLSINGLDLPNDSSNAIAADGTVATLSDGNKASILASGLAYTQFGAWFYGPASNPTYMGIFVTGLQTPTSSAPTSGTANYVAGGPGSGTGAVIGTVFVPDGAGGIKTATLSGAGTIGVDFGNGVLNGSFTNMNAKAGDGTITPWNSVALEGTISGGVINGSTSAGSPPGGTFGLSGSAAGTLKGALYGPNGQELGATWTLNEAGGATNGKSAIGTVAATKQ